MRSVRASAMIGARHRDIQMSNEERAKRYQSAYMADYGFESVMVRYRRKLLLERLNKFRPEVVVEVGCGAELLYEEWLKTGVRRAKCWLIVEPADQFADKAHASNLPNLHVVNEFVEKAFPVLKSILPRKPDMVICSSLLHEVPSVIELLTAIREIMGKLSLLHLNVPNSESLHRRLAKAMGLVVDTKTMSNRNTALSQHRVYDMRSLKSDLTAAGLSVIEEGGYFVKPFTHGQMEKIAAVIGDQVLDGLFQLGREMPKLASEIYVEARTVIRE